MNVNNEYPLLLRDRSGHAVTQTAQLVALRASATALEAEATQEGRLLLLEVVRAAGLDVKAFGWQDINLM
jgi:hypothetical protein